MTLEEYELLCSYWAEHPPLQLMVQAYLGIKAPEKKQHMDFDAFADFMKRTGGKIPGLGPA